MNLTKECNGAECIVVLHFEKLENGTPKEKTKLIKAIRNAVEKIGEYPSFGGGDRVTVELDDPGKVHTVLKQFGW